MVKKRLSILIFFLLTFLGFTQNSSRDLSIEKWVFINESNPEWFSAKVPGTVHTDLLHNNLIPDPFVGANEKQLQWIENENWEYETHFTLSESELKNQNIDLEFEGLDTYATVFLNGKVVLEANNMFRKWTISAKSHLKIGSNHLKVIFHSAVQKGKEEASKLSYTLPEKERVFVRKAQYQFGWDWGPRFVTAGIWKKVQLKFWNSAKIENIKFSQVELNDKKAILEFTTEIYVSKAKTIQLKINEKSETFNLKKGKNNIQMQYEIANPKLWWCNGLGDANLYPFAVEISQKNQLLDSKKLNIGLRTIELIQEKDQAGKSFYFKLNGKSVFMKGANMVPPDSFLPRVSDSTYFSLVENAKKANMNMLRVWGGGVYFDNKGIRFYTQRDYIVISSTFKGKFTAPVLGAKKSSMFSRFGNPKLKDGNWEAYQMAYGIMIVYYNAAGVANKLIISTKTTDDIDLCITN